MSSNTLLFCRSLAICLISASLVACGQVEQALPAESTSGPAELKSEAPAELAVSALPASYHEYHTTGNTGLLNLLPTSQGVCWLARMQGDFKSSADVLNVYHIQGQWKLAWQSSPGQTIRGKAYCLNWSAFKTPTVAQPARWVSDQVLSVADKCTTFNKNLWWGDAASYISRVGGDIEGISGVYLTQSTSGNKASQVSAVSCMPNTVVYGGAHSLFIGKPQSSDLPQFWGPDGAGVPYATAYKSGNYRAVSAGPTVVEMAPVDKAFCYLHTLWGNFDASSDEINLYPSTNSTGQQVWKLRVYNNDSSNGKGIGAYAACYMLTQY